MMTRLVEQWDRECVPRDRISNDGQEQLNDELKSGKRSYESNWQSVRGKEDYKIQGNICSIRIGRTAFLIQIVHSDEMGEGPWVLS